MVKPTYGKERAGHYEKLAALDAEIETDQSDEKILAWKAGIRKCAGKAQSVN